jgi:hypothetical protein
VLDFEIQRCTRQCVVAERELKPGEPFYSVLIQDGAKIIRQDYSLDAWEGPPENAFGFWKSEMPDPSARKLHWAPNDVMRHYFRQLVDGDENKDTAYVLTLLLVRRRLMRLEDTEQDEQGREVLVVYCPREEMEFRVPVVEPDAQRIQQIQEDLAKLLFAQAN